MKEQIERERENSSCDNKRRTGRKEKEMIKEHEWVGGWMDICEKVVP